MLGGGYFFDRAVLGQGPEVGDFFSDAVQSVSHVVAPILKPIADVYNKIPMPIRAALVPVTAISEYAYAHPEVIPMFGKQAAQAKALFEGAKSGKLDMATAANIATQAIGPSLHLSPQVTAAMAQAAHMAAASSPLASQALQIAHASAQATHPAAVPKKLALKLAPPPPAKPAVHLQLAHLAAQGAPPPPVTLSPAAFDDIKGAIAATYNALKGRQGFNASFEVHV